jgi:site-specific DNA recombinase
MNSTKQVGIWIRVSTDMQVKDESPAHHEKRARLYAEAKGWDIVEVYRLEGVSGKSVMEHPETKRMLEDVKAGRISGLIFSKLARLARNTAQLLQFSEIFRTVSADLISLSENIDTSSPAGRLFFTIISALTEWERAEIAERVAASVPVRATLGKPLNGQASFGYRWQGKEFVVDEKEAPVRKLMYELFLKTRRKIATAKALNDMGYRTRNGSMFGKTTVVRLLRDTTAKGERRANYTTGKKDGAGKNLKPETEWVILPCPAIVSAELWSDCNRILDDQLSKVKRPGPKAAHLLSGYVSCSCGSKMYVYHKDKNPTYRCKPCNTKIEVADLDEMFYNELKTFLMTETEVSDYMQQTDAQLKEKEHLLALATQEIAEIRKEMAKLVKLRLAEELNRDSFMASHQPLEEQVAQLENLLPALEAEIDYLNMEYLSADSVFQNAKDLYCNWPIMSFEQKRSIVESITESITVEKDHIRILLEHLPPTHQNSGKSDRKKRIMDQVL